MTKTELTKAFNQAWKDFYPENVVYLSEYRLERGLKYPGAQYHIGLTDAYQQKIWLQKEVKRKERQKHNQRVLKSWGEK